eukprot:1160680-Pelagomonas_calceolata.AAC.13
MGAVLYSLIEKCGNLAPKPAPNVLPTFPALCGHDVMLGGHSRTSKIVAANKVSPMFETLRDQKQVNELDPSRLKLIKVLGRSKIRD